MALQEARQGSSLECYISEVRFVWGNGKDAQPPFKVKALMEKLFASTSPDDPWMGELIRHGKPATELHRDPDFGFIFGFILSYDLNKVERYRYNLEHGTVAGV